MIVVGIISWCAVLLVLLAVWMIPGCFLFGVYYCLHPVPVLSMGERADEDILDIRGFLLTGVVVFYSSDFSSNDLLVFFC